LVGKEGIVAFHDIVPGHTEAVGDAPRFLDDIKHQFKHIELVRDWKQDGFGIGLVYL